MREQGTSSKAENRSQRSAKAHAVDQGVTVLSYLIGGVLIYGGLGWLGDHFFHTNFLLPLGIVLGAGLAVYTIIKRFGTVVDSPAHSDPTQSDPTQSDPTPSDPTQSDPAQSDPAQSDPSPSDRAGADRVPTDRSAADDDH